MNVETNLNDSAAEIDFAELPQIRDLLAYLAGDGNDPGADVRELHVSELTILMRFANVGYKYISACSQLESRR